MTFRQILVTYTGAMALLLALALPSQAQSGPAESMPKNPTAQEKRGAALLQTHCASCHSIGLDGTSSHPEAPAFRTLSQNYPVDALQEALAEGIMTGHQDMPEFAFQPEDVGAIIAYLESVQPKAVPSKE